MDRLSAKTRTMDASRFHTSRWHAALAVVAALLLYVTLPQKIVVGPLWLLPLLVLGILIPLLIVSPHRHRESKWQRMASIVDIGVLGLFNIITIALLLLAAHRDQVTGEQLLLAAVQVWLTNILVYALLFWELDWGGPPRDRTQFEDHPQATSFLFPQMTLDRDVQAKLQWRPQFIDYLFVAFTNATAFSPTDTFPLRASAKILMMAEAMTSLVTIAIVAGRAFSMLGGG